MYRSITVLAVTAMFTSISALPSGFGDADTIYDDLLNITRHGLAHRQTGGGATAGRDCGDWTFYCGGTPSAGGRRSLSVEEACNNACYYIYELNDGSDYIVTHDSSVRSGRNREQSGCQAEAGNNSGSVCNTMPFSQHFHDHREQEPVPRRQGYNCDEFPMASMGQNDFTPGTIRNSLRCISASHNGAAGAQFGNFVRGRGRGLAGRTCSGPLRDGDTYRVVFNYDGADLQQLPQCPYPGRGDGDSDRRERAENAAEHFYLTQLRGQHGHFNFPYDPSLDNHYALSTTGNEVLQCRVEIRRTEGDNYRATVFDVDGTRQGSASRQLPDHHIPLRVRGQNGLLDLLVHRWQPMGNVGTRGGLIGITYGSRRDPVPGVDIEFDTDRQGTDPHFARSDGAVYQPSGWCRVPDIADNGNGREQDITCFFPCTAT